MRWRCTGCWWSAEWWSWLTGRWCIYEFQFPVSHHTFPFHSTQVPFFIFRRFSTSIFFVHHHSFFNSCTWFVIVVNLCSLVFCCCLIAKHLVEFNFVLFVCWNVPLRNVHFILIYPIFIEFLVRDANRIAYFIVNLVLFRFR